ncbi:YraN family protein [Kaarinaea lacus]
MGLFGTPTKLDTNAIGQNAEDLALRFLKKQGMKLIERNYHCKAGELDLVMQHKNALVFVEVRYRKHTGFGSGAETIDRRKQQKILKSAEHFLQRHSKYAALPCRIDVISITALQKTNNQRPDIDWIPNAIQA